MGGEPRLVIGVGRVSRRGVAIAAAWLLVAVAPAPAHEQAHKTVPLSSEASLIAYYAQVESGLLGVSIPQITPAQAPLKDDYGQTLGYDASGGRSGPEVRCVITFSTLRNPDDHVAAETAAHEVFHCLSAELAPNLDVFYDNPPGSGYQDWLDEGGAVWAESDLVPNDRYAVGAWLSYLRNPDRPLFTRRSSAIGFFGHLAACGIDVWDAFRRMFATSSDAGAYAASGATGCLDTEASEFFNNSDLGEAWYADQKRNPIADGNMPPSGFSSHGLTFEQRAALLAVRKGEKRTLSVKPFTDGIYRLQPQARFTELLVHAGTVRLHSTEGPVLDEDNIGTLTLCNPGVPDACHCPSGATPPDAREFKAGDLAITGGSAGALAVVVGLGCTNRLLPNQDCTSLGFDGYSPQLVAGPTFLFGVYSSGCEFDSDSGACPTYSCFAVALGVYPSAQAAHQEYAATNGSGPSYRVVGVGSEAKYWSTSVNGMPGLAGIARVDNETVEITQEGDPEIDVGHLLAQAAAQLG